MNALINQINDIVNRIGEYYYFSLISMNAIDTHTIKTIVTDNGWNEEDQYTRLKNLYHIFGIVSLQDNDRKFYELIDQIPCLEFDFEQYQLDIENKKNQMNQQKKHLFESVQSYNYFDDAWDINLETLKFSNFYYTGTNNYYTVADR